MTWLLKLYPPSWRRRYGDELTDLIARQPFSVGAAVDIIAGAIDAWIHPQASVAPFLLSATKGEATMLTKIARFNCGYGPTVTAADQWKSAAVYLGGTVVLTMIWLWTRRELGDNAYIDSLSVLARSGALQPAIHVAERTLARRSGHFHCRQCAAGDGRAPRGGVDCFTVVSAASEEVSRFRAWSFI